MMVEIGEAVERNALPMEEGVEDAVDQRLGKAECVEIFDTSGGGVEPFQDCTLALFFLTLEFLLECDLRRLIVNRGLIGRILFDGRDFRLGGYSPCYAIG